MITDTYFEIGSSHTVCQDYAFSGKIGENIKFVVVADGCSSSHDITGQGDVGARILALSAGHALKDMCGKDETLYTFQSFFNGGDFVKLVMCRALKFVEEMGLSKDCLDATIVFAISDGKKVLSYVFGDGCVMIGKKNGESEFYEVSYPSNAPFYMTYVGNASRIDGYIKQFTSNVNMTITKQNDKKFQESRTDFNHIDIALCGINIGGFELDADELTSIAVMSDGVGSYGSELGNGSFIVTNTIGIVNEVGLFSINGKKFVERRFKAFQRKIVDVNKWKHYDDVSVGAILF